MDYLRHMEYRKNEPDMHPQTGETKNHTTVDVYVYPDRVLVWGWGWSNTFRPGEKSLDQLVSMVEGFFKEETYKKIFEDCPALSKYADARAELGDTESAGSRYLEYIEENITTHIDFPKLARSYQAGDQAYAKAVLNLLHQAAQKIYGITDFTAKHCPYRGVELPGVAQYPTGEHCIAVCALDLDHHGACLLSHHLTGSGLNAVIDRSGIKFDFTFTAPCDQRGKLETPAAELLSNFHSFTADLGRPVISSEKFPGENDEGWDR